MSRLLILLVLAGCEQSYRYPCQNPENWTNKVCQKPVCEVNQTCPDHIFADQKRMEPWISGDKVTTEPKEDKGGRNDCAK